MHDFEKLGVFYLGQTVRPGRGQAQPGWFLYDSKDLTTHAVCVGMTGSGKTGLCLAPGRGGDRQHAGHRHRPEGRPGQSAAHVPDAARRIPPLGQRGGRAQRRASRPSSTGRAGGAWRKGLAEWGQDGGADPAPPRGGGLRDLHARQHGGLPVSVLGRSPRRRRRCVEDGEALARADRRDRVRAARPARHRGGSAQQPRAHPALDDPRPRRGRRAATSTCRHSSGQIQ